MPLEGDHKNEFRVYCLTIPSQRYKECDQIRAAIMFSPYLPKVLRKAQSVNGASGIRGSPPLHPLECNVPGGENDGAYSTPGYKGGRGRATVNMSRYSLVSPVWV